MNDLYIIVPASTTLADVADVLRRHWTVSGSPTQPRIDIDRYSRAYLTELDMADGVSEELFLDEPELPERLRSEFGDFRVISLRHSDRTLADEMSRAIASSELAKRPMLLEAEGSFISPSSYLAQWDRVEDRLMAAFSEGALIRGDEAFFDLKTARAVVVYCRENNLAVSGMEGVTVEEGCLRPRLDLIADFSTDAEPSWKETVAKWDDGARRVLERWEAICPDVRVSMTVMSPEEWIPQTS